ncbi:MAG: RluA family pseudouridine synthase [Saccharofermentans sp.]|nr:RluA family pseudouridine synthase [Saccharofermentans sp.]
MPEIKYISDIAGVRLDVYIASKDDQYSRSFYKQLIKDGKVMVNGQIPSKSGVLLEAGDEIVIDMPEPEVTENIAQDIPLDIVYEDSDLLVINKPQGLVVHPAAGHKDGTLVNALLAHCGDELSDINGVIRPGIVHRIDKDTSGLMLACKNNDTHLKLADMLSRHEIVREYRAIVYGVVAPDRGTVDAPIARSDKDRRKMAVAKDGKPSITHFEVIQRYTEATDLSLLLETGRTHQIRVHMSYIGHPVAGDPVYASRRDKFGLEGQALHSASVTFTHPGTGEQMHFEAPLPDYYTALLSKLTPLKD